MRSAYGQINRLVFKYRCQLILLLGPRSQTASRRFYFVFVCVLQHSSDQYIVLALYFCYLFLFLVVALVFVFAWWIIKKIISDSGLLFYLLSSIPGFFVVLYSISYFIVCLVIVTKGEGGCVGLRKCTWIVRVSLLTKGLTCGDFTKECILFFLLKSLLKD